MMTRIHPKRQRTIHFEALEERLALSNGMAMAAPHVHAEVMSTPKPLSVSFRGHVSISGLTVTTTGLTGTIGKDHFTGFGTGTIVGTQFGGGDVYLSNSKGSIHLKLSASFAVHVGKSTIQEVAITALAASGKYVPFTSGTGLLTRWNLPAKPNGTASFSGVFIG